MHAPTVIEKKRDGKHLSESEIRDLIRGYTLGEIPDYQMSAFAMAVYFQGMSPEETAFLTRAMLESGEVFAYPDDAPSIVDKHSTGGIGDKVSLVLAPLLACDEVWVPMISGRGLGITGGTLDKLESISGFRVGLSQGETLNQLRKLGVAMIGQTADICPADKKLYSLRDVTATVPSQPLIIASIMSKKLAETLDALVLDVKYGSGAFMETLEDADSLAHGMQEVGEAMGVRTSVCLTPMDEPLGRAVGNALEVGEAIESLQGRGPSDLRELTLDLAEKVSLVDRSQLRAWLDDGAAWDKFQKMVNAQGGAGEVLERWESAHPAKVVLDVVAESSGTVGQMDARKIGRASLALGAGRSKADDDVDFSVGFDGIAKIGEEVRAGDVVGRVHAKTEKDADVAKTAFIEAISIK